MELELAFSKRSLQAGDELASEDTPEDLDREEEGWGTAKTLPSPPR